MKVLFFLLIVLCVSWTLLSPRPRISLVRLPENLLALRSLRSSARSDARFGQPGRASIPLPPENHRTTYDALDELVGPDFRVDREIPAEFRVYPTGSSGMDWHSDQKVRAGHYYEAVLTLFNDSDSVFQYRSPFRTVSVSCPPGRLVLVRPHGPSHRVTPVTEGSREILKFVVVPSRV